MHLIDFVCSFERHPEYIALVCIEIADYITGFGVALKRHQLNSALNKSGMVQKIITITVPLVLYPIFKIYKLEDIFTVFIYGLIVPNILSLAENLDNFGIALPEELMKYFSDPKDKK